MICTYTPLEAQRFLEEKVAPKQARDIREVLARYPEDLSHEDMRNSADALGLDDTALGILAQAHYSEKRVVRHLHQLCVGALEAKTNMDITSTPTILTDEDGQHYGAVFRLVKKGKGMQRKAIWEPCAAVVVSVSYERELFGLDVPLFHVAYRSERHISAMVSAVHVHNCFYHSRIQDDDITVKDEERLDAIVKKRA